MYSCFLSYSPNDSAVFTKRLHEVLQELGYTVWQSSIEDQSVPGFRDERNKAMQHAQNVLFVLSPLSITDTHFTEELALAIQFRKHIIPIRFTEHERKSASLLLPTGLAHRESLCFGPSETEFEATAAQLHKQLTDNAQFSRTYATLSQQAQHWLARNKSTEQLLKGHALQQAINWLQTYGCLSGLPEDVTDVQAQFIMHSHWEHQQYQADYCIIASETDRFWIDKIKAELQQRAKTVVETTEPVQAYSGKILTQYHLCSALYILYLKSENTSDNKAIADQLALASTYQKPIIQLVANKAASKQIVPNALGNLFLPNFVLQDVWIEFGNLINGKSDDYIYHRQLLTQAWLWEYNKRNVALLLRNGILEQAKTWRIEAEKRHDQVVGLTVLQQEFIEVSAVQVVPDQFRAFIVHGAGQAKEANRLRHALEQHGRMCWVEPPLSADITLRDATFRGIEISENILILTDEHGNLEPEQKAQIGYASRLKKRFVAVSIGNTPEKLSSLSSIDLANSITLPDHQQGFYENFGQLICCLDSESDYLSTHTRILVRTLAWHKANSPKALLLQGDEYITAQKWLDSSRTKQLKPEPSDLQTEYILQSQKHWRNKQLQKKSFSWVRRLVVGSVLAILVLAVNWGYTTFLDKNKAELESDKANKLYLKASANNLIALAGQLEVKNPTLALRLAEKAQLIENTEQVQKTIYSLYANNSFYKTAGEHKAPINDVIFYAPKNLAITCSDDYTVKLWAFDPFKQAITPKHTLKGHTAAVTSLAVSANGEFLATSSADKTVRIWNLQGDIITVLTGHDAKVSTVAFSPDSKQLVTAGADNSVILWSVQGDMLKILPAHQDAVRKAIFTSNDQIVSVGNDHKLIFWNTQQDQLIPVSTPGYLVNDIAYSATNQEVAFACSDHKLRRFNLLGQFISEFTAHNQAVLSVSYSPSSNELLSASSAGQIALFTRQGQLLRTLRGHEAAVNKAIFAASPKTVFSVSSDLRFNVWQLPAVFIENQPTALASSTDLPPNLSASVFVQLNNATLAKELPMAKNSDTISAILTQNNLIAIGFSTGRLQVTQNGKTQVLTHSNPAQITALAYDSVSGRLLSGDQNQQVTSWLHHQLDTTLHGHKGRISSLAISSGGEFFATGSTDGTIRLYNKSNRLLRVFVGHEAEIRQLQFNDKGSLLASSSADKKVQVWETAGYAIRSLTLSSPVVQLAFRADTSLSMLLQTGQQQSTSIPIYLDLFRYQNNYQELSIAQMLDLKIKFYEELHTEQELEQGALFYFNKATQQPDPTLQLRNLVYADSLFTKLHQQRSQPIYYAEHLQVCIGLRQFEHTKAALDQQISHLFENLIRTPNQAQLQQAVSYLEERVQQSPSPTHTELNYTALELLYRRLYLEYSTPNYLVGRYTAELMLHQNKPEELNRKKREFLKLFQKFDRRLLDQAATTIFSNSETTTHKWLQHEYLLLAQELYATLLESQAQGSYFVNLTEVLLHLQEVDSSDLDLVTKIKNISVQLFALRDQPTIQDAADRFLVKAERESSLNRKQIYFTNAETLYGKLFRQASTASVLINQRKVLLGLRRILPNSTEYRQKAADNLTHFSALTSEKELLVTLRYFDREVLFTPQKAEQIQLLTLSFQLYQQLLVAAPKPSYYSRLHKVILQLNSNGVNNVELTQQEQNITQQLAQLTAPDQILEALNLYAQWQLEITQSQLKLLYIKAQQALYIQLLTSNTNVSHLIRAWKFSREWLIIQPDSAVLFQQQISPFAHQLKGKALVEWQAYLQQNSR